MPRFWMHEHMHKGRRYRIALQKRGYKLTENINKADFVFLDHDVNATGAGRRQQVYIAYERNIPLFLYPHSSRPNIMYDIWRPWEFTKASFTIARGHKQVLKKIGYKTPVEITGWTYTPIKPFSGRLPEHRKIRVLFAPIHPLGSGYLPQIDTDLNFRVFKTLLKIPDIEITARYLGRLEENKLFRSGKVKWIHGLPDGSTHDMENADVIIGSYTYAYMAVALGKPLVMMGEWVRPHAGNHLWAGWGEQWEKYKDYLKYPYNIEETLENPQKTMENIIAAIQPCKNVDRWKKRFIGKPFDPNYFVDRVEKYL